MRVKLSFTVEEEDALSGAAKVLQLGAEDLQQAINLFAAVQAELKGETEEENSPVNIRKSLDMIEEFRAALLNLDIRLGEIDDMVRGFDRYLHSKDEVDPPAPEEEGELPSGESA